MKTFKITLLLLLSLTVLSCNNDDGDSTASNQQINYGCFGDIYVGTQAALDSVAQTIPAGCNSITRLSLGGGPGGSDITSLASLSNVVNIRYLQIQNCPQLTSLEGLHNIREILYVEISNTGITDFNGLRSLKTFSDSDEARFYLSRNNSLVSLNGLQNLDTLPRLEIYDCNALQSFHGLENCKQINNNFILKNCPALTSFSGADIKMPNNCEITSTGLPTLTGIKIQPGTYVVLDSNLSLSSLGTAFETTSGLTGFTCRENPSLVSLEGMEHLTASGSLYIMGNELLQSLNGLQSLTTVDYIDISFNNSLQSLNGMQSLTTAKEIEIKNNNSLNSLLGLEGLNTAASISIKDNPLLASIEALNNLTSLLNDNLYQNYTIDISNNPSLLTLNGLQNISNFSGNIFIRQNASLKNLCALTTILPQLNANYYSAVYGNYNPATLSTISTDNCSVD
jgi:hypothetical protein